MKKDNEFWAGLVRQCKNRDNFPLLEREVEPILRGVACARYAWMADDAVQVGLAQIWRRLPTVDLQRKNIKSYILSIGFNAMRDEVRRLGRIGRHEAHLKDGVDGEDMLELLVEQRESDDGCEYRFDDGILAEYRQYIADTGSFDGAHRAIADKRGCSVPKVSAEFYRAAREFIRRHNIDVKHEHAGLIQQILEAGPKAPESIETQLKRAIRQSGLSLREIARRSGIAHNTINNFIKNQSVVSIESTDKIFFALGKRIKVL